MTPRRSALACIAVVTLVAVGACTDDSSPTRSAEGASRPESSPDGFFLLPQSPGRALGPWDAPAAVIGTVVQLGQERWSTPDGEPPDRSTGEPQRVARFQIATIEVDRVLWSVSPDELPPDQRDRAVETGPRMQVVLALESDDFPDFVLSAPVDEGDRILWIVYGYMEFSDGDSTTSLTVASMNQWTIIDGMAQSAYWPSEPRVAEDVLIERLLDARTHPERWQTGDMRNLMNPDRPGPDAGTEGSETTNDEGSVEDGGEERPSGDS